MNKINDIIDKIMTAFLALAMLALLLGGTWQIFTRWVIRNPSTFTDEFLRYALIWSAMIGSAYCFYKNEHLALDLFTSKAKGVPKVILTVFIELAIIFFVVYVFIWGGIKVASNATNASSVMKIPFKILYAVFPISGVLIVITRIIKYVMILLGKQEDK